MRRSLARRILALLPALLPASCGPGRPDGADDEFVDALADELAGDCLLACSLPTRCDPAAEPTEDSMTTCVETCSRARVETADAIGEACIAAYVDFIACIAALDCPGFAGWETREAGFACEGPTLHVEAECPGLLDP